MNRKLLNLAQLVYFPLVVFLGWRVFGESSADISQIISQIKMPTVLTAGLAVLSGLMITGIIWTYLLGFQGYSPEKVFLQPVFFIGQLAKYIPGSVWVFGVQAHLASKLNIPRRATVTTGLIFVYVSVVSASILGSFVVENLWPQFEYNGILSMFVAIAGLFLLSPIVVRKLVKFLGLSGSPTNVSFKKQVRLVLGLLIVWIMFGSSVKILGDSISSESSISLMYATSAFAVAYALGVLAVFSPAGIGVREGVLIYALTPEFGLEASVSIALITRLIHTSSDFLLAIFWFLKSRSN